MKKISLFALAILISGSVKLRAQWTNVDFSAKLQYLMDIYFTDPNTGFICGYNMAASGPYNIFTNRIYRTTNAGTTWTKVFETIDTAGIHAHPLHSICFTSPSNGFVVGDKDALYPFVCSTVNGGLTWDTVTVSSIMKVTDRVYFPSASVGFMSGSTLFGAALIKTTNGGATWTDITSSLPASAIGGIRDVFFLDNSTGFICTSATNAPSQGAIYKTTNGGTSWTTAITFTNDEYPFKLYFVDSQNGFATGTLGDVWKTTNGGTTWTAATAVPSGQIDQYDIYFSTPQIGYTFGGGGSFFTAGIFKTTNGGTSWTLDNSGLPTVTTSYYGATVNGSTAYACGVNGYSKTGTFPVGMDEETIENSVMTIFPNPASDKFTIKLKENSGAMVMEIFDATGRCVIKGQLTENEVKSVDLSEFPSGIYLVGLTNKAGARSTARISKL